MKVICYSIILLLFSKLSVAQESFNPIELQKRFDQFSSDYNTNINFEFPPNCWGTMFHLMGLTQDLDYLDFGPVISFFLSKSCEENNEASGHSFVHIDTASGPSHSYYLGHDMMAWQKFDPNEFSLIRKEPHRDVIDYYEKIESISFDRPFDYNYFNCSQPSPRFRRLFALYLDHQAGIDEALALIRNDLQFDEFDMGLYLLMLYTIESKTDGHKYVKRFLPKSMVGYQSEIDEIKEAMLSNLPENPDSVLNALLDFYLDVEFFIQILNKINERGGASNADPVILKKILFKIEFLLTNSHSRIVLLNSNSFNQFINSLIQLDPSKHLYMVTKIILDRKYYGFEPRLYNWMLNIARSWTKDRSNSGVEHFILYHLYEKRILLNPVYSAPPDEEFYSHVMFMLAAGHYFPNSYIYGWQNEY